MKKLFRKFFALPILRKQSVAQATIIISILTFLSKFVGYAREVLTAKYFGTSWQLDAYLVGSQVPMMVLGIFAGGFGTLIIPKYLEYKKRNKQDAIRYVNQIFVVWGCIFLLVSIFTIVFAHTLVHIVAIGFKGERLNLAVVITRYLSLFGFLNILLSLLVGILHSEKQFFIPTITTALGNLLTLFSLLFLTKYFGIQSMTVGSTLLIFFDFVVIFSILFKKYQFFHFSRITIKWSEIRNFGYLLLPLTISSGMDSLNAIADKTIASTLSTGAISAINYSSRIWGIPMSLIALSFTVTLLPHFSEKASDITKLLELKQSINKSLIFMFYFMIPISILLLTMSLPIVRLFYQRGAFNNTDTQITTNVNRMYSLGLVFISTNHILYKAFYALKKTWIPLLFSIVSVAINFYGNIILAKYMGVSGIALSTSIVNLVYYIVGYYVLDHYFIKAFSHVNSTGANLVVEFSKVLICSILTGGFSLLILPILKIPGSFILSALKIGISGFLLSIVYLFLSYLFQTEGYIFVKQYLVKFKITNLR